ncbi:MAG TPA: EamA family transporter [Terriglobales bacterium]|jgi:drug/metabolite transporter (DMT)-like permease
MLAKTKPNSDYWALVGAFAVIYLLWGTTFLAIKIGVAEVPPLIFAVERFIPAGALLYAWCRWRGVPVPTAREWRAAAVPAAFMVLIGYGCLFWGETRVTSGIAAVIPATIPVWVALLESLVFRLAPISWRVIGGAVLGVAGVTLLVGPLGGGRTVAALVILIGALAWAVGTVLVKRLPLPKSTTMSSAAQMLLGGAMLAIAAVASGQVEGWHPLAVSREAVLAWLYLVLAGSVLGYSAYVWLLGRVSATKVSSYALVNPVVALAVGWMFAGERVSAMALAGTGVVLAGLALVLARDAPQKNH